MSKKMYYSQEEAAAALGIGVEELNAMVSAGKLRAYQDGARKMYKSDDIEALGGGDAAAAGETGEIELSPADTADTVSLTDTADVAAPAGKEDTVITAEGISIFDDEDLEIEVADPMAKTQIAPSLEDQVTLEGVGSGSGLLDLTRESDDTSLGAEVLDHIDMEGAVAEELGADLPAAPAPYAPPADLAPVQAAAEQLDAASGLFGGIIVGCALVSLMVFVVMLAAMGRVVPGFVGAMKDSIAITLVVCVVVIAIFAGIGAFIGNNAATRRRVMAGLS